MDNVELQDSVLPFLLPHADSILRTTLDALDDLSIYLQFIDITDYVTLPSSAVKEHQPNLQTRPSTPPRTLPNNNLPSKSRKATHKALLKYALSRPSIFPTNCFMQHYKFLKQQLAAPHIYWTVLHYNDITDVHTHIYLYIFSGLY